MKLFWSSRSPFVRKVMVFAHETGLADKIECVRTVVAATKPNAEVMAFNPLSKLPTLVLADGTPLYDSRVIVEYLDGLHGGERLFPATGKVRFEALRLQALGDGILDFLLMGLYERLRPEARRSPELVSALAVKFQTAFDNLEREAAAGALDGPFGIGPIAISCALGYADFRYEDRQWREGRPRLEAFAKAAMDRPSLKATAHADVY